MNPGQARFDAQHIAFTKTEKEVRYMENQNGEPLDCFQRALIYLYTKRLEKLGVTAEITVTKIQNEDDR